MTRHVLLMLSLEVEPHPVLEVQTRAEECAAQGYTYLITPCRFTEMQPGESEVAFFGDKGLGYAYLGKGTYLGYIERESLEGRAILEASPVYSPGGVIGAAIPHSAQGFIHLRDVTVAPPGTDITSLHGIIVAGAASTSNGLTLTVGNVLARGRGCLQTYYTKAEAEASS